jgi:hypothetical protein
MRFIFRFRRPLLALLAVIVLALLVTFSARAGVQAVELTWSSIDGGGVSFVSGGSYTLGYTLGQFDTASLTNGATQLKEGFWGGILPNYPIFIPSVRK